MDFKEKTETMMRMAAMIADMAERDAPNFENVSGDTALRQFADAIRRANASATAQPSNPVN